MFYSIAQSFLSFCVEAFDVLVLTDEERRSPHHNVTVCVCVCVCVCMCVCACVCVFMLVFLNWIVLIRTEVVVGRPV